MFQRNPSIIRGGDSVGMLEKLYSGNLLPQSTEVKVPERPLFLGIALIAHKILTICLIKLWKHLCRIIEVRDPSLARISEGLLFNDDFS